MWWSSVDLKPRTYLQDPALFRISRPRYAVHPLTLCVNLLSDWLAFCTSVIHLIGGSISVYGRWLTYLWLPYFRKSVHIILENNKWSCESKKKKNQVQRMAAFLVLSLFLLFPFGRVSCRRLLYLSFSRVSGVAYWPVHSCQPHLIRKKKNR